MLQSTPNQPTKFRTKNSVEINDDLCGRYHTNSKLKFETSMLRTSLCDYRNTYILARGTIIFTGAGNDDAVRKLYDRNKGVIFKTVHHLLTA